jgi:hypothetical protein
VQGVSADMSRILRCAACTRRIKAHHAHVGLIDYESGREISYHAHPNCQKRGAEDIAAMIERGRLYILRHYHASACPDAEAGFGCAGGCFSDAPEAVAN